MYYIILEYIILIIPSKRKYSYIALLIKETWLCELIILCIKKACLRCATAALSINSYFGLRKSNLIPLCSAA